jgi:hypothetical protein
MAMTTRAQDRQHEVRRRIHQFYTLLNRQQFDRCYKMIDPRVRVQASSVTLFQYTNALRLFMEQFGPVEVLETNMTLHLEEPSTLYEGRDFAVGKTVLADKAGGRHVLLERWVREGRSWYTRSTGFVTPDPVPTPATTSEQQQEPAPPSTDMHDREGTSGVAKRMSRR